MTTDSITINLSSAPAPSKHYTPLFKHHLLQPDPEKSSHPERFAPDWFTLTLLGVVILFTWYKIFYHRMFVQLTSAFFSMSTTNQVVRDESVLLQRASFNASAIVYLTGGLFLYQLSKLYHWESPLLQSGFARFITFALAIAFVYSLKMLALRFLSNVFNVARPASTYIFTIFLFNMMAGLFLLPIVIMIAYAPSKYREYLAIAGILLLALVLIYRLGRVFIIWMSQLRNQVLYLFLYLCSFEIAPLVLIWKLAGLQQ